MTKAEIGEKKISYDRQADLSANGFEWIKFWAKKKGQDPPTQRLVHFEYDTFVSLRKAAGIKKKD